VIILKLIATYDELGFVWLRTWNMVINIRGPINVDDYVISSAAEAVSFMHVILKFVRTQWRA
jgi:hypothetical protein